MTQYLVAIHHPDDWPFVQKILDLSEGHNNAKRARLIIAVLRQLRELRHARHENASYPLDCRAWLLAIGKPITSVA
jgi:hypothetical protein